MNIVNVITPDGPADILARRLSAVFTIVQDEHWRLSRWLGYYRRQFREQDIYIVQHTTPNSPPPVAARFPNINLFPVYYGASFDHDWLRKTVTLFQAMLLQSYNTVLFAEVDEFVIPDPDRYGSLKDYMAKTPGPVARCTGYDVVHVPSEEPPLNLEDESLLAQRRYWKPSPKYDKTLIAREPVMYDTGFHRTYSHAAVKPDPHLFLVHTKYIDLDLMVRHNEAARQRNWSQTDVEAGHGIESWKVDREQMLRDLPPREGLTEIPYKIQIQV